ncbi:heme o synthase [Jeongeupia wiesaeckerbachi]|uniref:heme o synthase n=1 Tax=Jeongeupia wiesaeckerbachi TaxID=3051218 RepID=UPI003D809208
MKAAPFKRYLQVVKPGIVMGNLISSTGGFLLAAHGQIDWSALLATLIGLSLVVAAGCAFNNCIDRDIDAKMARTQKRVLVSGAMSVRAAFAHGCVLALAGFGLLALWSNGVALACAAFGFVIYVGVYSLYMKRHSVWGTMVGSLSGAAPPVAAYCAARGQFDLGAAILLLMFCLWQMPHSYAIAIFRFDDYRAAGIPVLPVVRGIDEAKKQILLYIIAFALATTALAASGYVGAGYLLASCATSLWWVAIALSGRKLDAGQPAVSQWARQVFKCSVVTITVLSVAMAVDFQSLAPHAHWGI